MRLKRTGRKYATLALFPVSILAILCLFGSTPAVGGTLPYFTSPQSNSLQELESAPVVEVPSSLCRFGVNAPSKLSPFNVSPFRVGWYQDYTVTDSPQHPNGIQYFPTVRLKQTGPNSYSYVPDRINLQKWAERETGAHWFIGNEPDIRFGQDDLEPHVYARAYHELYHLIKDTDPTAQILAGSISQPTPLRLQYLDMVVNAYEFFYGEEMPVDGWSIHLYMFNEASCDYFEPWECWGVGIPRGMDEIEGLRLSLEENDDLDLFRQLIYDFRTWMMENDYRDKPLYVSEFGILLPEWLGYTPDRVVTFMHRAFDLLLSARDPNLGNPTDGHRLVQRFAWFSTTDITYNGRLFDPASGVQTAIGDGFEQYASSHVETVDFYPSDLVAYATSEEEDTATLHLRANIASSGDHLETQAVSVAFYVMHEDETVQQIGETQRAVLSGCGDSTVVETVWQEVALGSHQILIRVDPANAIVETDEVNNSRSHFIQVYPNQVHLPLIGHLK